jgi:superfamily I DNA and RNA helicase
MKTVITSSSLSENPQAKRVIQHFQSIATNNSWLDEDAVLYFGFPRFCGYEEVKLSNDLLFLSKQHGILLLRFIDNVHEMELNEVEDDLDEFHSLVFSKLYESKLLRVKQKRSQKLKFNLEAYFYHEQEIVEDDLRELILNNFACIDEQLDELRLVDPLSNKDFNECRSILEGTKALVSNTSRILEQGDNSSKAYILSKLEAEIKNFDFEQRSSAISMVDGPQRIRGLAGSGKTIVLAMKAANLHLNNPTKKILITFYTKSLYDHVKNLITKFYRHFKKVDPNWEYLDIKHAWGGSGIDGVYYSACVDNNISTIPFKEAIKQAGDPFDYICRNLLGNPKTLLQKYDYILVDEAQDMPVNFFRLVYAISLGEGDQKNIIWGYDELQNIFKVKTRSPKELFGADDNGDDLVDLDRSAQNNPNYLENDIVLKKCYRNPREILIVAHALGFGLYKEDDRHVQGLEGAEHWEDLGYKVIKGDFKIGSDIKIERPQENSPLSILEYEKSEEIIKPYVAVSMSDECDWVCRNVIEFLEGGLKPEDILIIALDDRRARNYFSEISSKLLHNSVRTNNVLLNPYDSKQYMIKDSVTLSTIHRAKGNEAPAVIVLGIDALHSSRNSRNSRNKIFTAFTRAKVWLRVSGVSSYADYFVKEIQRAQAQSPYLVFTQQDPSKIDTIQRDLSDKRQGMKKLKEEVAEQLELMNLSEEEKSNFFKGDI